MVLLAIGLYVRLRIAETPVFAELVAQQQRSTAPIAEALRRQAGPILLAGGALSAVFAYGYIGTVYLTSYATAVLGLPRPTMLVLGVAGGVVLMLAAALGARWSDRVGRRRVVLVGNLGALLVGPAVFPLIETGQAWGVGIGLAAILAVGGFGLGPGGRLAAGAVRRALPLHRRGTGLQFRGDPGRRRAPGRRRTRAGGIRRSGGRCADCRLRAGRAGLRLALPETKHRSLAPVAPEVAVSAA